ncbi:YceI family protein [Longimicrobium sp.]|uniref:YceI family protein n=1 Tax=Longimicrobium sp. TaxID=2029185 RepID=UPI002F93E276
MAGTSTWQLDPAHTSVEFSVKHMMMTTVRGRFKDVKGTITVNEESPDHSAVEVEIAAASLDTGVADRDAHLRSGDFFDAEHYPRITFRSRRVEGPTGQPGGRFRLTGVLTIRDTPMEVELDCVFQGSGQDPWGKERIGFGATGQVDRRDWGLRWNQSIESGGVLVANQVKLDIEAQFVKQTAEADAEI